MEILSALVSDEIVAAFFKGFGTRGKTNYNSLENLIRIFRGDWPRTFVM